VLFAGIYNVASDVGCVSAQLSEGGTVAMLIVGGLCTQHTVINRRALRRARPTDKAARNTVISLMLEARPCVTLPSQR